MDGNLFQNHEKRKFDRKQLYYYLKVYHDQNSTLAGYLGDISTKGLMLFTKESVELDKVFHFRINLDQEFGMDADLVVEARSLWCEPDANPEYVAMGFKFSALDAASLDRVKYLIKKYGFEQ